jgi:hypothetical protein
MLSYFRSSIRSIGSGTSAPVSPTESRRHSTHFGPWASSPVPRVSPYPLTPSYPIPAISRGRPVSLPPTAYSRSPPWSPSHPINHSRFSSQLEDTAFWQQRSPRTSDILLSNGPWSTNEDRHITSNSDMVPKFFLFSILLIPWYWLLSQWPLQTQAFNATRASSVLLPELLLGGTLPIARRRAETILNSPHSPRGETDNLIRTPSNRHRGLGSRQAPRRRSNPCSIMTTSFLAALGGFAISAWRMLGGRQ